MKTSLLEFSALKARPVYFSDVAKSAKNLDMGESVIFEVHNPRPCSSLHVLHK